MIKRIVRTMINIYYDKREPYRSYDVKNLEKIILGKTVEGRDIEAYKIGDGSQYIVLQFGMHGNEVGTVKLAQKMLEAFDTNMLTVPTGMVILIVPCLNKDGFEKALKKPDYRGGGKVGKMNAKNIELVRNIASDEEFIKDESTVFIAGKTYKCNSGDYPFSEPESQAVKSYIKKYKPKLLVDFHNAYPAIDGLGPNAEKIGQWMREKTGFKRRDQLHKTPDVKRYVEQGLTALFVEGVNRYSSDRNIHKQYFQDFLEYLVESFSKLKTS